MNLQTMQYDNIANINSEPGWKKYKLNIPMFLMLNWDHYQDITIVAWIVVAWISYAYTKFATHIFKPINKH